jgi:hypothetical protein
MNAYIFFALRVLAFIGLVAAFVFFALSSPPGISSRLIAMFGVGAYLTFFVEGPSWGTLERISARPLVVVLGLLMMGGAAFWLWSIRGLVTS